MRVDGCVGMRMLHWCADGCIGVWMVGVRMRWRADMDDCKEKQKEKKKRKENLLNTNTRCGPQWMRTVANADGRGCRWSWMRMVADVDGGECGWQWMRMVVDADGTHDGGCKWRGQ